VEPYDTGGDIDFEACHIWMMSQFARTSIKYAAVCGFVLNTLAVLLATWSAILMLAHPFAWDGPVTVFRVMFFASPIAEFFLVRRKMYVGAL